MFILSDERLTWMPVNVPRLDEAGNPTTQKLRVKVVLVDYDRFIEITDDARPGQEREIIHELSRDWEGVKARNKSAHSETVEEVPFSAAMLDKAIQQPMFIRAFFDSYFAAWRGQKEEREGNSAGSPANGPGAAPAPNTAPLPATPTASG